MKCELNIDSLSEDEKMCMTPSYLRNYSIPNYYSSPNDYNSHPENIWDKLRFLEADLNEMKEKLRKIERVMPWISEDFEMDEDKSN